MYSVFEATRELKKVQDEYLIKKDEYDRQMDALTRREEQLQEKDLKFQESLIKFNRFLQENENKRHKAVRQKSQEETEISACLQELKELKETVQNKKREEVELRTRVDSNVKYRHYLKNVVDLSQSSSGEFSEIQHIIDRYELLKSTSIELHNKIQNNTREHEAMRFKYAQFMKCSGNEILTMNNQIARLQKEVEQLSWTANRSLEIFHGSSRKTNTFITELTRAIFAISHMKEMLGCDPKTVNEKSNSIDNESLTKIIESKVSKATGELQFIAERIIEYQEIIKESGF